MGKFVVTSREDITHLTDKRKGDLKLGESVQTITSDNWEAELKASDARFVLLGIPEDIGIRAEYRQGDTVSFWPEVLTAFLNLQDHGAFKAAGIMVLGSFDFEAKMALADNADTEELSELTEYVDNAVSPFIQKIAQAGKVPIVIGGGHNNAYGVLKGVSEARNSSVNCINLDAFSDFKTMDRRHAGNGFRYAHRRGYLNKYAVVGLQEYGNSQEIMEEFNDDPDMCYSYYEDIFVREKLSFYEAVNFAIARTGRPCGLDIDFRCIDGMALDTMSCGIAPLLVRQFITWCTKELSPVYLHLAEGSTDMSCAPALAATLIADFIRAYKKK